MLGTTGFGAAWAAIVVIVARLETRFGAAARFVMVLWAARGLVAFTIAMHHGWRRAAVIVARALIVIATEVAAAWRHGAAEVFRAARAGALPGWAKVWTMAFLAARGAKALGLWHATFHAPLWRRALAMILRSTMHHGWGALTVIGAATEGLATVTVSALHLIATDGWAATFTRAIVTTPVTIAGTAEVLLAVAVAITGVAMALRMVAFASGFGAGTAGIALAVIVGMGTAFGLATIGFGPAFGAAAIGLTPIGFTSLRLGAFAFGIGAGYFAAWWGFGLACFRGGSRSGSGWFGGFLGGKGGDAEGAEREQHEAVVRFGFHGLEAVDEPWEIGGS